MKRRDFIKDIAVVGSVLGTGLQGLHANAPSKPDTASGGNIRPNILFVMTDQQRYDALGCHGGPAVTPNLDRLAASGADLQAFFTQAPVCVPSRQNLFTGRARMARRGETFLLQPHEIHLYRTLKENGYYLGYTGKNHLLEHHEFENFDRHQINELKPGTDKDAAERRRYKDAQAASRYLLNSKGSWASGIFFDGAPEATDTYLDRAFAVDFIRNAPAERPFCLTVSFNDPHVPHVAPAKFRDMYPLASIRLPDVPEGTLDQKQRRYRIKREGQCMDNASADDKRHYLAVYYAMVSWIDENVGAILDALQESGRAGNTIIVFTSDHGDFACEYDMVKKDLVLPDSLIHVPCLVSWPGVINPQSVDKTMADQIDIMPTLLDYCGIPAPIGVQGKSLKPLLEGKTTTHKDEIYAEVCQPVDINTYPNYAAYVRDLERYGKTPGHRVSFAAPYNIPGEYNRCLRTKEWKYIWYNSEFEELYDLVNDPRELHNLATNPAHQQRCREMKDKLWTYGQTYSDYRTVGERLAVTSQYPKWKS
ncbi:MAG: sulfatase-like hydrolase/transferase [Verrucomicrobiota bacterium]|nr:sulfatase-like hydrolase/transferase [Verrucomicrobiota bacterium]